MAIMMSADYLWNDELPLRLRPTDVFSTYRDGTRIGESAMIIIDSVPDEYEKIEVMGKLYL